MGCNECKNSPKTYEEFCMSQSNPSVYCPDAYTEKSHLCGNYGKKEVSQEEDVLQEDEEDLCR